MGSFFTALITPSSTRGNGWDAFPTTETSRKCCSVDRGNIKPNHKPSDTVLFGQFPYVTAVCFIVWVLNMGHGRNKNGICKEKTHWVSAFSLSFLVYGKEQLYTTKENGKNTCKLTTLVSHGYWIHEVEQSCQGIWSRKTSHCQRNEARALLLIYFSSQVCIQFSSQHTRG